MSMPHRMDKHGQYSLLMKLNLTVSFGGILVMTLEEMLQATSGVLRIM